MPEPLVGARPLLEVADVIRSQGAAFLQKYGSHLSATQKKALRDLAVWLEPRALGPTIGLAPSDRQARPWLGELRLDDGE